MAAGRPGRAWLPGMAGLALLLGTAAWLLPLPAPAQTAVAGGACLRQCGAASSQIRENRPEQQACLIRCQAAQDFTRQAEPAHPAAGRPPARPGMASTAPRGMAPGAVSSPVRPVLAAQAAPRAGSWGAAYLAPAPSHRFGLSVGMGDRMAAHGQAQAACTAGATLCRPALEFAEACGAIAQSRHPLGLVRTSDPSTFQVTFAAAGAAATQEAAEAAALAECRLRDRASQCMVVASACRAAAVH